MRWIGPVRRGAIRTDGADHHCFEKTLRPESAVGSSHWVAGSSSTTNPSAPGIAGVGESLALSCVPAAGPQRASCVKPRRGSIDSHSGDGDIQGQLQSSHRERREIRRGVREWAAGYASLFWR